MSVDPTELADLLDLALRCAERGGDVLREQQARLSTLRTESKGTRRELVTEADRAAEAVVVGGLLAARPDDAVLAEEGALTPAGRASSSASHLWIVDPLDGTTNFVHGLPFHAVAIGLTIDRVPVLGVVHAPALGKTWAAATGFGATLNGRPIHVSRTGDVADALLCTGFSYVRNEPGRDDNVERIRRVLPRCRDLRRYGSAQLDLCMTADGTWDGYWELYLAPYDVAAGAVIVREAGGTVTDLCGGDDWLFSGNVLATNGALHPSLLDLVGGPA